MMRAPAVLLPTPRAWFSGRPACCQQHGRATPFQLCTLLTVLWSAGAPVCWSADVDLPAPVLQAEQQRVAAVAKAIPSAVAVFSSSGGGGGSAVIVSADGFAVSNFHVTSPVGRFMKCGLADGQLYDAVIVGIDPVGDVAVIKLLGRDDFVPAELADSDEVAVGDWCFAVGNPFLLATDFQPTVTYGIVSGVHRYQYPAGSLLEYADCIQTDAAINPGNSGGPLFNAQGQLIGINGRASFEKRNRVNVGLGYAISVNQVKNFLGHLKSGRIVDHATLGATVSSDVEGRVIVSNILETSDAYRRGLRYGDEVIAFGGRSIDSVNAFKNVLGIFPRGWRIPLSFLHDAQRQDVHVRLTGVHAPEELLRQLRPRRQPGPRPRQRPENPDAPPNPDDPPHPSAPQPPATPSIPEHLQGYYEARTGYANFAFNRRNVDRVWKSFGEHGDFSNQLGSWLLKGSSPQFPEVGFELTDEQVSVTWGDSSYRIVEGIDLSDQLAPDGSGGLLAALHLWRRMLVLGPEKFGDVYYLGTCPLPSGLLCDTLVATYDVVETHFYFDPETGLLAAVEMFPEAGVDPCELYWEEYRSVAGRQLPHKLVVRFGNETVAEIRFEQFECSEGIPSET